MVERFFLDRVDVTSNEFSIGMGKKDTPSIFPDAADAKFSIGDEAMVAAQEAENLIPFFFII